MNLNKVIIAGNLTRDPQIKFLANEQAVANFGLAVNRKWKDKDGTAKEEVTFVDIEVWGRLAELCGQYLAKGRGALIVGRLKLDTWEDKEGKKQSKLRVVADEVQFMGAPGERKPADGAPADAPAGEPQRPSRPARPAPAGNDVDGEPPF